ACRQILRVRLRTTFMSCSPSYLPGLLVAAGLELDDVVLQLFLVADRRHRVAGPLPGSYVGEVVVVALGLAFLVLVLGAEVAAAGFLALLGVAAHQHAELEEVVDATGLLERLVDALAVAGDTEVLLEFGVERRDLRERLVEALLCAFHAAVIPDDLAELAMEPVGRAGATDRDVLPEAVGGL